MQVLEHAEAGVVAVAIYANKVLIVIMPWKEFNSILVRCDLSSVVCLLYAWHAWVGCR